jgi:phosphopantothenate---cysteine ligase (CTP)
MSKPLKILITGGGIFSKIDDIRFMGNFSQGTTGALIAEEFLKKGHAVTFLHAKGSKRPLRTGLTIDPEKNEEQEISRIQKELGQFRKYQHLLEEISVCDFQEYHRAIESLISQNQDFNAVILAAAVADYGGDPKDGKISSDFEKLEISLPRNPKVISFIKKWNPKIFQVGFKLLTDASTEKLIEEGYRHGIKSHSNLTVANSIENGSFKHRSMVIITPEKGITPVKLEGLASKVAGMVIQRISKKHYRTELKVVEKFGNELRNDTETLKEWVKKLWKLNLFEPYFEGSGSHFGFVAKRIASDGFLITARGSDKENFSEADIVHVTGADFEKRILSVTSIGKKASLNANVTAKIFAEHPGINIIFHAHVFPGFVNKTTTDFSPGTQEDLDEVTSHLRNGKTAVELKNHGIVILGNTFEEIVRALNIQPAYSKFPHFYDVIYGRFQKSTDLVNLVKREVGPQKSILDLAAGTGEVAWQLLKAGYQNISLADLNEPMLKIAKIKIGRDIPTYTADMKTMRLEKKFDAIVVRQAINYLMDLDSLENGFRNIFNHLNLGGVFIFNAPNFTTASVYGDRTLNYESGEWYVKIEEKNLVEGKILTHTQRCTLIKKDGMEIKRFYDLNRFGLFTKEDFEESLHKVGFTRINFFGKNLKSLESQSKSLRCVCTKT